MEDLASFSAPYTYIWNKEGEEPGEYLRNNNTLTLNNLTTADNGYYLCRLKAEGLVSNHSAGVHVIVQGRGETIVAQE